MKIRIATLLLLSGASLPALASESPAAPDGGKGCPGVVAPDERENPGAGAQADESEQAAGDKAAQSRRGGNAENGLRGPRMHSLLPGMFR